MSWTYEIPSGRLLDPTGTLVGKGYSGQPPRTNDATAVGIRNVGPIPPGLWQAVEMIPETRAHGPFAIRLEPYAETDTLGRSGFMMHGDSSSHPGYASDGCIIMARLVREEFWASQDHDILVTTEIP